MQTYTLHLPDGPIEIAALDIIQALAYGRHQLRVHGVYGTFRLVNDTTGKTNHVQRYRDKPCEGWRAAPDAPLAGPFNYGLDSLGRDHV